jgi:peptidoglycan/xylan/chitin deacetylase (PgdA/CDA1 family)
MYHSISDEPEIGHPYYWINTSPARFAEHMKYLYDNGYQVIPLNKAVKMIRAGNPNIKPRTSPPGQTDQTNQIDKIDRATRTLQPATRNSNRLNKPNESNKLVVLTFDDGYLDFYSHAFPIIQKYGLPATVFLPTDFVDTVEPGLRGKQHLNWDMILELKKNGVDFGSHTCSHIQLYNVGRDVIQDELVRSQALIISKLEICQGISYPYKFPDNAEEFLVNLQGMLKLTGYDYCLSTRIGTIHSPEDLFALKRIPVNSDDDPLFLEAKLTGGYDWLYNFQVSVKKVSRLLKNI